MKGRRHTTEQKIRILREAESSDKTIQDVCRVRQISEQPFRLWKREMGMLEVDQEKVGIMAAEYLKSVGRAHYL